MTDTLIAALVTRYPGVIKYLKGRTRWIAFSYIRSGLETIKTYDYFLRQVEGLVRGAYANNISGEFIDVMANLISGQLTQAFEQAWNEEGDGGDFPAYLSNSLEEMILGQYEHVDGYYRDIVDARIDATPIEPLLARASLWAQRWTEAYNEAIHLINVEDGGKEIWQLGETEKHCWICSKLNGIVLSAREWDELGVHPQGAPNPILSLSNGDERGCGGWQCDCSRKPTDQRRTPKGFETVMNIISR